MHTVELRSLHEDDAPVVQAWLADYLREHRTWWTAIYGREPITDLAELVRSDWDELVEASTDGDSFIRVAAEPEPVGVVSARKRTDRFMGFEVGVLAWIYVDPRARGRGVADLMLTEADAWMREQGVAGRQVYVTIANRGAVRLYERHGYRAADYRMLGE